jgi:5'-nucleotidase (lipoprotein e(P4) family)
MKVYTIGETVREVIGMKRNTIRKAFMAIVLFFVLANPPNSVEASMQQDENVTSILWYQQSAEADALYRQGYELAKLRLDQALQHKTDKDKAIILDIDETVLNNSPFLAQIVQKNISFNEGWDEWVSQANAKPLPGALEFLQYADMKGITIFYVTNREKHLYEATEKNLKKAGFPQIDNGHLILLTDEVSKESRRKAIEKNHNVILLLGDNLIDFSKEFDSLDAEERKRQVELMKNRIGNKFIVFPNPMYGNWEEALNKGKVPGIDRKTLLDTDG